MNNRVDTDQADILDAVVARLINQIDRLNDKTCFPTMDDKEPPYKPADEVFVAVCPTGGTFPEEFTDGGGAHQCTEYSGVIVTIWSRIHTDRAGRDREALANFTRGLFRLKKLILKALCSHDLTFNGDWILRNMIAPKISGPPDRVGEEGLSKIPINFSTDFDWNLTG